MGKSKDTDNARKDLVNMKIRPELDLFTQGDKLMKPAADFTLTPKECCLFCKFIKSVKFSDGFASNLTKNKIDNDNKITDLKSYDYHVIMSHLLLLGIRLFLNKPIVTTIADLCTFFKQFCARTLNVSNLLKVQEDIKEILCKLEMIFPPVFFDIMIHFVLHLLEDAILGGVVYM